jgi:hypothetical protein
LESAARRRFDRVKDAHVEEVERRGKPRVWGAFEASANTQQGFWVGAAALNRRPQRGRWPAICLCSP